MDMQEGAGMRRDDSWHRGRIVALDLETTAADLEQARVVQAAIVTVEPGQGAQVLSLLADPGVEIPQEATAVHGITTERARREGAPAADVVRMTVGMLERLLADGAPLVVFNARYDLTVLDREARRHGVEPLQDRGRLLVVDPFVVDRWLDRYRKGSRKLDAVCEVYGAKLPQAHDAGADALAAARLAWAMAERGEVRRRVFDAASGRERARLQGQWAQVRWSLRALHDVQVVWAAEQAAGLREHFEREGRAEDAASVRMAWPLIRERVAA